MSRTVAEEIATTFKQLVIKGKSGEAELEKILQLEFRKLIEKAGAEVGRKSRN